MSYVCDIIAVDVNVWRSEGIFRLNSFDGIILLGLKVDFLANNIVRTDDLVLALLNRHEEKY